MVVNITARQVAYAGIVLVLINIDNWTVYLEISLCEIIGDWSLDSSLYRRDFTLETLTYVPLELAPPSQNQPKIESLS